MPAGLVSSLTVAATPTHRPRPVNDLSSDVARVRTALWRELETINHYEELARQASSEDVRTFFLHLANEEKEHVAEATALLRRLDAQQEVFFQKDYTAAHFSGAKPAAAPTPPSKPVAVTLEELRLPRDPSLTPYALPAPPSTSAHAFTVGVLKRRDR